MTRTRWKLGPGGLLAIVGAFIASVNAVALSQCSSQNTGIGGKSSNSIYMSNGNCQDSCSGYAFAVTQSQNCWCSNEAPGSTTDIGSCNQPCPGYPNENCGNLQQGLYGYVALGRAPTGTMGGGGGGFGGGFPSAPASSFVVPSSIQPSSAQAPPPSTQIVVSSQPAQTIVQTRFATRVSTYVPPPSSVEPSTIIQTQQQTETQFSSAEPYTIVQDPSTSIISGPTSTITPTPYVVTSAQVLTTSGSAITQYITSAASAMPTLGQQNEMPHQTKTGLSNGAVAGATVGAIAGAALLAALIFLCCWRRKKNQQNNDSEGTGAPKRNASVLSRSGLLRGSNAEAAGPTLPQITTSGLPSDGGLDSAATGGSSQLGEMLNRRNSRPLFSDARLNPHALMTQPNFSRTSVSTLQDNQDYSRPLEVRNPDYPRLSHG